MYVEGLPEVNVLHIAGACNTCIQAAIHKDTILYSYKHTRISLQSISNIDSAVLLQHNNIY